MVVGSNPTRSTFIAVLKYGSCHNNNGIEAMESITMDNAIDLDPYLLFVNAIRSPLTRQKYFGRLNSFFEFIQIQKGSMEARCKIFVKNCNDIPKYPLNCVYRFVIHLKGKMEKGEIVVSTIYNYLKPIKLL